ncbi:Alanine racemase domain protein OS=Tsukamurella paurometabola (strain ATCC 8368 / DSM / CCUG 35730 / CIP 100753 / JCM 10117 / KCTC 9821 / NBRC 16120 / NCIMB 702349 / NCTC 13040) OX=521096 GN=Tpau_1520 PE=4 SV=1 [Tsukamurella paurometabola]|uniref:Alanine racemase domain protein n=1 Tax=Tsukamurella paurometabola (strain ATCC 8368 / DSM 20162 / CCUG 35730 / CIP 100753 / JCM 10117 / KCTC 9821 / NBRC 16120 / NCIMB 702349 / NCTC 13040) TaxID=521096 RepID=D5UXQ2_TSUPD|nr:alanine racemase [Tsukamurella paurometabola]ADG78144.1 alanine racemase domain protein [Tsukamurella paurometabola DSM 20162]SUP30384.1 Predicted amino acid aldolase or racemase [Tsukamurella paurometabola]
MTANGTGQTTTGTGLVDLGAPPSTVDRTWETDPAAYWATIDAGTQGLDAPVLVADLDALRHNVADMRRRAGGTPIRVASKSLRSRPVLDALLRVPGYAGVLAYDVAEAHWLAADGTDHDGAERPGCPDVLVGYPSADLGAIAALAADEQAASRVTLMIDDPDQLDLVDAAVPPSRRPELRICIDIDASFRAPVLGAVGALRSPIRTRAEASALAVTIAGRKGFRLVGAMTYDAQIAGVGDLSIRRPGAGALLRTMQRASWDELVERRLDILTDLRRIAELEFVNGGGTGSLERNASDPNISDIAAGSGLYGPHLFDGYSHFRPAPAMAFGLAVVRRPRPDTVTCHGGGWIASGAAGEDRLPVPVWPAGLTLTAREGAGEVQTPVTGDRARRISLGDRVWFRHTKAGEPAEHTTHIAVLSDGAVLAQVPTYRGEGRCFL